MWRDARGATHFADIRLGYVLINGPGIIVQSSGSSMGTYDHYCLLRASCWAYQQLGQCSRYRQELLVEQHQDAIDHWTVILVKLSFGLYLPHICILELEIKTFLITSAVEQAMLSSRLLSVFGVEHVVWSCRSLFSCILVQKHSGSMMPHVSNNIIPRIQYEAFNSIPALRDGASVVTPAEKIFHLICELN